MARPRKDRSPDAPLVVVVDDQGLPIPNQDKLEHPYQAMEQADDLPELRAVGYQRVSPTSREYVAFVVTFRGREVLGITVSQPDLKPIASDAAKINFIRVVEDHDQVLEEDRRYLEEEKRAAAGTQ